MSFSVPPRARLVPLPDSALLRRYRGAPKRWRNHDWKRYGVGFGFRPFWWQLGYRSWAGTSYLHFGPLFVAWHH